MRDHAGISLIEVLIASALVGMGLIGLLLMLATGQAVIAGEGDNRVAVYLAQRKLEQARAQGFASLTTGSTTEQFSPTLASVTSPPFYYTRTTVIDLVCGDDYTVTAGCPSSPPQAKRVTVSVRMQRPPPEARLVTLSTVLASR